MGIGSKKPVVRSLPRSSSCTDFSEASWPSQNIKADPEEVLVKSAKHQCRLCPFSACSKSLLLTHERTHTGERPFKCQFCTYAAAKKDTVAMHERTHTGDRPYKCAVCPYASSHSHGLKGHEKLHSGGRPYKCRFCTYSSTQRSTWYRHERLHIVEQTEGEVRRLQQTTDRHKGGRSAAKSKYQCKYCWFVTARELQLIEHERTHTGEKPYKCDRCDFAAARKQNLTKHQKKHDR